MSRFAILLAAAAMIAGAARADELRPIEGKTVALGPVTGVAYYTEEADGDRLVATLSGTDGALPLRVVAVLEPGQSLMLSVPRGVGEPAIEVSFVRRGDRVFMSEPGKLTN